MSVIEKLRELEAKLNGQGWDGTVGDDDWSEIDGIIDAYKPVGYKAETVSFENGNSGRWTTSTDTVYKVTEADGKVAYFSIWRQHPATEMQEGGGFSFTLEEVVPR